MRRILQNTNKDQARASFAGEGKGDGKGANPNVPQLPSKDDVSDEIEL